MTTSTRRIRAGLRGGLAKTLAATVVLLGMCSVAAAQGGAEGTTPPFLKPGLPAGTYPLSGFDSVNLFNGNLNFHLPLMEISGRGGARIPIMEKIEARWRVVTDVPCPSCSPTFYPTYNWWTGYTVGYGPGIMEVRASTFGTKFCTFGDEIPDKSLIRLTFTSPDGTEYEMRDTLTDGAPQPIPDYPNCPNYPWFNRGSVFVTADGTSATFYSCQPDGTPVPLSDSDAVIISGVLLLRDGTRYRIDGQLVTWMQNRNGNRINFFYEHTDFWGNPDGRVTRIIDSLNRQVTISYDVAAGAPYGTCDEISFKGFGGVVTRTMRVSKDLLSHVLRSDFTGTRTYHDLFPNFNGSSYTQFDDFVTSAIWLPDGRSYKFYYNDYGELSRVVLPTGGALEYDWGEGMINALTGGYTGRGGIYRRVLERRVYPNGASGVSFASKETYSVPETYVNGDLGPPPNAGYVVVKQFESNLNLLTASKHYFNGSAVYNPNEDNNGVGFYYPWNNGKEYKTEALDTDGFTVLQRAEHTFDQTAPAWWNPSGCTTCIQPMNNPRITQTLTTWVQTNQVAKQSYSYDQYNNKTVIQEFDYGTGVPPQYPTRRTEIDYVTTGEINGIDYTGSNIASNVNSLPYLRSLPQEQRVLSVSSTGATTVTSKTHFYYDQSALTDRPSITGWQTPVTAGRGNATSTSRWLDATGGWITTSQTYDIAGQVVQTTDAKGNISLIDFANSLNTYAYPTTLKTPVPDPTGQRGLTARLETIVAYDFASGLVTSITDPNGQVTTAGYNDALDRLTTITRPSGGGSTTYVYGDAIGNLYLRTLTTQDANQTLTVDQMFDGMGRAVETRTYEPGGGYISTKQTFDGIGRVVQTSNPFRPASESPAWTTTGYDALGRVRSVTTPDLAVVNTIYSGNMVMVTDQALKKRISQTNALGQLTRVWEVTPADAWTSSVTFNGQNYIAYQTSYQYDAMDDLVRVTQGSQNRYFMYDSLKRLIRARNPERDTSAGLALTDPVSGNSQWCVSYEYDANSNLFKRTDSRAPAVITTNTYDALNRVIGRTYSDATPAVTYKYDGAGASGGVLYSKGRLTLVTSSVSSYSYDEYDQTGRVKRGTQTTAGQPYAMSYGYDFAGNMTSETYPSGRVISNTYDSAGRLASVNGQKTGEPNKIYESQFSYSPHGAVKYAQLGNGRWEHTDFNNRLQPTLIGVGTSNTDSSLLKLEYTYSNSDPSIHDNNGNVLTQKITAGGSVYNQTYSYDTLNRLSSAVEAGWSENCTYDRYGNMWVSSCTGITLSALTPQSQSAFNNSNNNRLAAPNQYDPAGNLVIDALNRSFGYDAENRQKDFNNSAVRYIYDGDGRRVEKIESSATTVFVYNVAGQLVAEYTSGTPEVGGGTTYLSEDHLGSVRLTMHAGGDVKSRHDYLPFGEELSFNRSASNGYVTDNLRQRFTQKERDTESGLDYFGARYYSSAQGRFTSADDFLNDTQTNDPASWNLYAYVRNNPLRYVDPSGEEVFSSNLSDEEKRKLIGDLKNKTGYQSIYFDKNNKLVVDTSAGSKGGSAAARTQLLDAVNTTDTRFNLQSVDTTKVAFADVNEGTVLTDSSGKKIRTDYSVRVDFGDFQRVGGDNEAKEAFSLGLVLIHEFDHKIYNILDSPNSDTDPGPLENKYLNPIRRELGLAERVRYEAKAANTGILKSIYQTSTAGNYLAFKISGKEKILHWSSANVGGKVK